jgi:hypothetical protein
MSKQTKLPFGVVELGFDNVNVKAKVKGTNSIIHPQLSPSNVLPIPHDSKLLTDLSTIKLLLSGIHYPNICVPILKCHPLKPTTLSSHYLPFNSTNN